MKLISIVLGVVEWNWVKIMKSVLLACVIAVSTGVCVAAETVLDWRWLEGTTWYVPTSGLPAYVYTPGNNTLVAGPDQTVYTITGYRNGFFWGRTATKFDTTAISCKSLVGSVTPEGKVYLTFTNSPWSAGDTWTIGVGNMVMKNRQWTMVNQMSTGGTLAQIGHWAYMLRTRPGQASWYSLPGVNMSVPDFMQTCLNSAPTVAP